MIQLFLCELHDRNYQNDTKSNCIDKVRIEKESAFNLALLEKSWK
jgi:hypothetical protein